MIDNHTLETTEDATVFRRQTEIAWQEAKQKLSEMRDVEEPSWREIDNWDVDEWQSYAKRLLNQVEDFREYLNDVKLTLLDLYVVYAPVSVGASPEEAVRAHGRRVAETHGWDFEDFEIDSIEECEDDEWDYGAQWRSASGTYMDGLIWEVPGGYILTKG